MPAYHLVDEADPDSDYGSDYDSDVDEENAILTAFQITEYKLNELYSQKKLVCFKKISVL